MIKFVIHGLSMGGGIALDLAYINVKGIISDAPSVSIKGFFEDVVKFTFKKNSETAAAYVIERFQNEFGVKVEEFKHNGNYYFTQL